MATIVVGDRIKNTKRNSVGVDEFYGPYEADETTNRSALQVAEDVLTSAHKMVPGQTVGIKRADGRVVDYQVQPAVEGYELVPKFSGNEGGGNTPDSILVTDTTYTIDTLSGNKIYTFSNPLSSLTITAYGDTTLETVLYFTAGTGFNFSVPSDSSYIIEVPVFNEGMSYVVSIQNKTIVMGEIVEQTVSLNSIDNNE